MTKTDTGEFVIDVERLRDRAQGIMEKGPVSDAFGVDVARVVDVLNQALATELVCILRYKRHFYTSEGLNAISAADEFLAHAAEESEHADLIAARIQQLGGKPNFRPDTLTHRSHTEYDASENIEEMVREDLIAERIAVETYGEIIAWLGDADRATRRMLEQILANEQERADDMLDLLSVASY